METNQSVENEDLDNLGETNLLFNQENKIEEFIKDKK